MNLELWSDIVCPWCGIGYKRLQDALARFEHRDSITLIHRSFQLDPGFPSDRVESVRDMLMRKYRMNAATFQATISQIETLAAQAGLSPYIVGDNVVGNTALAHQLLALAAEQGCGSAAWTAMYRAYFGKTASIFELDELASIGASIGLDPELVRDTLTTGRLAQQVEADQQRAHALGANGVPFLVIDERYGVSGAQSVEVFHDVLVKAYTAATSRDMPAPSEACGPDSCTFDASSDRNS